MRTRSAFMLVVLGIVTLVSGLLAVARTDQRRADDASDRKPQIATTDARRVSRTAQGLVGAWQLTTRTVRRADGTVLNDPVLGDRPLGRLYYDASGIMMLQMMRLGRTAAIGKPSNVSDQSNPRVVLGYDAYFGRYTIDERAATITHHVEGSLFPEDLGKDFVRGFSLDGDTLTLRFTSAANGGEVTRTLVLARSR